MIKVVKYHFKISSLSDYDSQRTNLASQDRRTFQVERGNFIFLFQVLLQSLAKSIRSQSLTRLNDHHHAL